MGEENMTHREYEELVENIVTRLRDSVLTKNGYEVHGGSTNKILGKSGFPHQIDVHVSRTGFLLLIECKYWKDPVDAEPILVLARRKLDIQDADTTRLVEATIVSTKEVTEGAAHLARYDGIRVSQVNSLDEFCLMIENHLVLSERGHGDDSKVDVLKINKGEPGWKP